MEKRLKLSTGEAIRVRRKKLGQDEKRLAELDRLFMRLYEDNVSGKVSDQRFATMSAAYEEEQESLKAEVQTLQKEMCIRDRHRSRQDRNLCRRAVGFRRERNGIHYQPLH